MDMVFSHSALSQFALTLTTQSFQKLTDGGNDQAAAKHMHNIATFFDRYVYWGDRSNISSDEETDSVDSQPDDFIQMHCSNYIYCMGTYGLDNAYNYLVDYWLELDCINKHTSTNQVLNQAPDPLMELNMHDPMSACKVIVFMPFIFNLSKEGYGMTVAKDLLEAKYQDKYRFLDLVES
ncbi:hypothetical protein BJ085DRAFT_33319 [Dimargaris cristalligena]|uniref:Uncharacterized protein n=1 Tax=Dimargaris cristalligena TaxID=215637 RepID=A0A4P9ZMH4_9FUNG|nr:hypothetical protein BJ085DRAFT_33319 [Dimargaris cristalligena]|eukprot:RKP33490.1 hypothetical protein BJ085DRAFT_33319 [Dimargaris cristalligena]